MKQKKVFYFDEGLKEMHEEKEIRNAERLMSNRNPKLKKAGQFIFARLTGQYDELPHSNSPVNS